MFNKISLFLLFILIPVMLLNGCIEHTFNLTVLPDEGVDVVYSARGDVMDFNDEGQLMPDSTVWDFNMWIEEQEDETIQNVKASLRIENLADLDRHLDWRRSKTDTLNLRHRFTVEKTTNPLGVDWVFTGVVFSRGFNLSYGDIWDYVPAECRALDDAKGMQEMKSEDIEILEERFALGVIQWNIHRFTERFDRVWNLSATHLPGLRDTSETTLSIAKAGWVEDLHQYLNKMDLNEPTLVNLDWWSDLRPLFLGHLIDITGPETTDLFSRVGDAVEEEYQISKDIEDDSFNFIVKLPGRIIKSNGSKSDDNTIKWEFSGKELQNEDMIMTAKSFQISIWRAVVLCFLTVLILTLLRRVFIRRRGQNG